ncbi:hypothetical protein H0H87_009654 [Tephrocybe sp. NHM501043]|nr:hypothetical protein H0H87_009654 [Tephrocybe sp. NHM501043]
MAPRRRCPTCGSRQWHKEPSSGLIACSEGHVLQNYRNEVTEADDLGHHALRKRTMKSGKKNKEPQSKANPLLYHGARGRYHYFECLQLMLRKQIATLVKLWALPQEFEVVCHDIWALHIDLLPDPPSAEPYHYAQEARDDDGRKGVEVREADKSDDEEEDEKESGEGEGEGEKEGRDEDPELAELMRSNSDADDSSGSGDEDEPPKHKGRMKGRSHGRKIYEGPASTIAVLMVGCWTLRIPVLCRDLTKQVEHPWFHNDTDMSIWQVDRVVQAAIPRPNSTTVVAKKHGRALDET